MKKSILSSLIIGFLALALSNIVSAYSESQLIGDWKCKKITRKGKKITKKDPLTPFSKLTIQFDKNNVLYLKQGKYKIPGKWSIKGKILKLAGGIAGVGNQKGGLNVKFKNKDYLIAHYKKDDVKLYLIRK